MDTSTLLLGSALAVLLVQCVILAIALRSIRELREETRRTADQVADEVRSITQLMAARIATDSMPPAGRGGSGYSSMPLESETPAARRYATAPKSVVKAAVEFSNSAFDAFAKPPPAFADTQALDIHDKSNEKAASGPSSSTGHEADPTTRPIAAAALLPKPAAHAAPPVKPADSRRLGPDFARTQPG